MAKLQITQIKSSIGRKDDQQATLKALGLKKIRDTVSHDDNVQIRGMISRVSHLVEVTENN